MDERLIVEYLERVGVVDNGGCLIGIIKEDLWSLEGKARRITHKNKGSLWIAGNCLEEPDASIAAAFIIQRD